MSTYRAVALLTWIVLAAPLTAVASDANPIDGTWATTVTTPEGGGHPTFRLTQNGSSIHGSYVGQFGQLPVQGTVSGSSVELRFIVTNRREANGPVVYRGTLAGDTMQGTVSIANAVQGTFTAERLATHYTE